MISKLLKLRLSTGISVASLAVGMMAAVPAEAQTTSSIQGHIDGAAAGTAVTFTDTNTGRTDSARTDANGNYQIVGVPPSTYRVQTGGKTQTVTVPLGQAVTVDFLAAVAATGGASGADVVVIGSRARDVKTPTVSTNVSRFQIENLPNGDRNFLNFAALAPGVTVSPPQLGGKARQVQAGGINSDNTNTFIDGVSIKNLVNHGGTNGQNYSSGNPFPASAVDQFDVQVQNFKAEFEQAGSAVISSITKTGGRTFHGEIFGEWQPKSFISQNYDDRPGNLNNATSPYRPKPNFSNKFYGGNIGGPIIPGKLHFFIDYEGTNKTFGSSDINVYPTTNPNLALLSPAAAAYAASARSQYNGSYAADFKESLLFGKLTWFATPADTVNLTGFRRRENNLQINGGITTTDASTRNRNNEDRYQVNWTHRGSGWLNELIVARDKAQNGAVPNVDGSSYVVTLTPGTVLNTGNDRLIQLGGTNFTQDDRQRQFLIKDNVTVNAGDHTVKFGGKVNFTKLQRLEDNNGSGTYFYDGKTFTGLTGAVPYAASINAADVQPVSAKNTEIGAFVQDDWRPDDHWQISAGLRWDYESNARNENFVTPPAVAAALRAYPGFAAAGFNPDDYISTGSNRKHFFGAFQPRLGVSYDVKGDRDLVLTAGAGRYYDRSLFIDSAIETIKDYYQTVVTFQTCASSNNAPGCVQTIPTDPAALRALAATQGGEVHLLNNDTKVPYSDQFSAGVRKRFGRINTSASVSYIRSHNIFQEVVGNRFPDGSYGPDQIYVYNGVPYSRGIFYGPSAINGAPLIGVDGTRYGSIFIGNSDGKASYAALYLQADKPYTEDSGYGFSAALTLSTARSNDTRNTNSIGDPFNFDAPTIGAQGWGPTTGLERWRFVGSGTVRLPLDIRLSTIVTLSSGPKYGGVLCNVPVSGGGTDCYTTNFGIYHPKGIGYKNVDLNVTKSFKAPWNRDQEFTVYFQALNVFDFVNRNYSMWGGGFQNVGGPGPTGAYDPGSVASQGRNFKVGARFKF
ncbi:MULTISPECIES: TonB-dependent receptor [Sphingomonas]|uniref:TonB-dependent receptor n=1 Tax=Sphingomonas TaxID=13687 RepID=UPI000DEFAF81|nr:MULTISPECIES: TonB-dependent receptor [Sphingomonas]